MSLVHEAVLKNGERLIELENECGLKVTLSSFGAGIFSIYYDSRPMLGQPSDYDDYAYSTSYYGKTVGPIAGRVKEGKFEVGGKLYRLPCNEKGNCLHSASLCYAFSHFEYEIDEGEEATKVVFHRLFEEKKDVYPASIDLKIIYALPKSEAKLRIDMVALPDEDAPLNITNHVYFNLGGEKDLYEDILTLRQGEVASYGSDALLLSGFRKPIKELDFSSPKALKEGIDSPSLLPVTGYDHCFLLKKEKGEKARLENGRYRLSIDTDADGLQIYSCNFPLQGQLMQSGYPDCRASGITFEPVSRMDRPFNGKKGEAWSRFITYSFSKKGDR